jgi:hypothetical protein
VKSSALIAVYARKRVPNGPSLLRTITTRHEKKGWKVLDFTEPKELEKDAPWAAAEQRKVSFAGVLGGGVGLLMYEKRFAQTKIVPRANGPRVSLK